MNSLGGLKRIRKGREPRATPPASDRGSSSYRLHCPFPANPHRHGGGHNRQKARRCKCEAGDPKVAHRHRLPAAAWLHEESKPEQRAGQNSGHTCAEKDATPSRSSSVSIGPPTDAPREVAASSQGQHDQQHERHYYRVHTCRLRQLARSYKRSGSRQGRSTPPRHPAFLSTTMAPAASGGRSSRIRRLGPRAWVRKGARTPAVPNRAGNPGKRPQSIRPARVGARA